MTTVGILLRNESLKTFRRIAFLVTAGVYAAIVTTAFSQSYLRGRSDPERAFALPDAWHQILSDPVQMALFFSATVLILLIGSEFSWRTARQNVIDGLSRNQWFAGKVLLLPIVALVFLALPVVVGGMLALAGTAEGAILMTTAQARLLGAAVLAMLGLGSIALFFAFAARSGGPGLGMFFLWIALLEQLGGAALARLAPSVGWVRDWFPGRHFIELAQPWKWDPAAYRAMANALEQAKRPVPAQPDQATLAIVSVAYIALFLIAAYAVYRSRDL